MFIETDVPNGCIKNYTLTRNECTFNWWEPSTNESSCIARKGIGYPENP